MMFKLGELGRYVPLGKQGIRFLTDEAREVRLEVLAEEEVKLYVLFGRERHYAGTFEGYDVVTFNVPGVFEIVAIGGPCKCWCTEFDSPAVEIPEAVSFTRSMSRRTRNPELELMMQKMQERMEARIAQVEEDVTLRVSAERRQEIADVKREALEELRAAKARRDAERLASEQRAAEEAAAEAAGDEPEGVSGRGKGARRQAVVEE